MEHTRLVYHILVFRLPYHNYTIYLFIYFSLSLSLIFHYQQLQYISITFLVPDFWAPLSENLKWKAL